MGSDYDKRGNENWYNNKSFNFTRGNLFKILILGIKNEFFSLLKL